VKNSFVLYYLRQTAAETAQYLLKPLRNQKSFVLNAANDDRMGNDGRGIKMGGSSCPALKP